MKLLLLLLTIAGLGLAQDQSALHITVTMPDGTEHTAKVTGAPAAAGLDVLTQWLATQQTCVPSASGNTTSVCTPKYPDLAEMVKALVLDTAESLAPKFPSAALAPLVEQARLAVAAVNTARAAAFAAAKAEK